MYDFGPLRMRMLREVESAIERKMSLPGHWYADTDVHRFEQQYIFGATWQPVGSVAKLQQGGDYLTATVAGVPILIVRGDDASFRAFRNMCRHRGHPVADGCGNKKVFSCPFHGWTYRRDGTLLRATRSEREQGFQPEQYPLIRVRLGIWGQLAFVNLQPEGPEFGEEMATLLQVTAEKGFSLSGMTFRKRLEWEQACNWKTFVDNSADCYHCRLVHPNMGTTHYTDPDAYVTDVYDQFVLHISRAREDRPNVVSWLMCQVWPNWAVSAAPGHVARVRWMEPLAAGRMRVVTDFCAPPAVPDEEVEEDARWYHELLYAEDRPVCEGVDRNHAAFSFQEGPVFLASEGIVHDFQKRYRRALAAVPSTPAA
jgi:choline monooxygenase